MSKNTFQKLLLLEINDTSQRPLIPKPPLIKQHFKDKRVDRSGIPRVTSCQSVLGAPAVASSLDETCKCTEIRSRLLTAAEYRWDKAGAPLTNCQPVALTCTLAVWN